MRDGRTGQQERARDLLGSQATDHPQGQCSARFAREQRMACREDEPQQLIADVIIESRAQIRHRFLLLLAVSGQHPVLALEH